MENDKRNAFFWNLAKNEKVLINGDLLSWCGYSGEYKNMKSNFLSLLKKNPQFAYSEIEDLNYRKKRYIVMNSMDFESLLMQMRSAKAFEVRKLYSILKYIVTEYSKYETRFDQITMLKNFQ